HARICSILRKENIPLLPGKEHFQSFVQQEAIAPAEKDIIRELEQYPQVLENAANDYNPSLLCNYTFRLAQLFNSFYDQHSIAHAESEEKKLLRLMIIVM